MAKTIDTVSLAIQVEASKDKAGDSVFRNKTFSNVRKDVDTTKLNAVAEAIKAVISVPTGETYIIESSVLTA
jgi:hypothetical protein